jgi:glycosyltransferase involved in cell wall biosynthesis
MTPQRSVGDISLLLLTFNQERTARAAAEACLAQQGGPYEIVFSDDASSDGSHAVLLAAAAAYRGPHRVVVRRNEVNLGIGEHYNRLVAESRAELLVTAAGDDISLPQRMQRLVEAWDATGRRADLIASHLIDLDHDGTLHDIIRMDDLAAYRGVDDWIAKRPFVVGAGNAFTRRMMQRFGPLDRRIAYEDQVMVFRAIVGGGAVTVDEALVQYRRGGASGRPGVESGLQLKRWRDRESDRNLFVSRQLVADAELVGCGDKVRALLGRELAREGYKHELREAAGSVERWRLFRQATGLPLGWRFRKLLHEMFPSVSYGLKRRASKLHRRAR